MGKPNWPDKSTNELLRAIVLLQDTQEAAKFFRDLLTEKEIAEFANRWKVAQMLDKKVPYTEIEQKTGMSSTTIARIKKWLTGGMGGYKLMLEKVEHHHTPSPVGKGLS